MVSVSVVIPCYRCANTIERAIASVAAQTLQPSEVILVDDASGDGTRAALTSLASKFASGWIKLVLLDQNVGAGCARNAGWAVAQGKYVAFLDADDAWHLRKIEIQYAFMQAHPDVVLSGHGFRISSSGALPYWSVESQPAHDVDKWLMLLSNRFVTPSVMIQREVEFRFVEHQRYMEDHMLWLQVVCSGVRVVKLPLALTAIYKDQFGATGLSSHLWPMQRSDMGNYQRLYHRGCINRIQFFLLISYSLLKYLRRLVIYSVYIRWKK